ncbi:hypothetical protein EV207_12444 [Scopulibacillus darangshiensis]|uniref:YfhD-like protein n=1 Tax=Scopulibacillus darangshiensis TaxID=442528 RepID=A0A4R2NT16_9BACL|nr:YfhD family protein [Scopulibacillus darangshiensis]TCP24545.1 hypothetical protein EV207_12444 [Scopulibacillus darangshiensis]
MDRKRSPQDHIAKNEDVEYTQTLDTDDQEALERAEQADKRAEKEQG